MENSTKGVIYGDQELLVRLNRNNEVVQKLSIKISFYIYEPRCASHFEKYIALKSNFRSFGEHQRVLAAKIKRKKGSLAAELEGEVHRHLDRYKQLESDVADYLLNLGERP